MKRICAWCGEELGPSEDGNDNLVTHGICETCEDKMYKEYGWDKEETTGGITL